VLTLESGLVQGLGAELVFAVFLYRRWGLPTAVLSGAVAGIALAINDLILWYPGSAAGFAAVYVVSAILSGAVIAGLLSWIVARNLARTGVLSRFASGRLAPSPVS
jgi:energy-coupling factor transport system substrate-specific component